MLSAIFVCHFYLHNTRCLQLISDAILDPSSNTTSNASNNTQDVEDDDDGAQNNDEDGMLEGSKAQSDVKLACTPRKFYVLIFKSIHSPNLMLLEEHSCTHNIRALAVEMDIPDLPQLIRLFLYDQLLADDTHTSDDIPLSACPQFKGPIKVFNSAATTFFASSDPSGVCGMQREHIRATPSWRGGPPHYDTVFINTASEDSINGMEVGWVLCFFSFSHRTKTFPCALIHWFKLINNKPDPDSGMWMVRPSFHEDGSQELSVIHLDTIIRASHLMPIFGAQFIDGDVSFHNSLDSFAGFYVNKFIDHHSFEIPS